MMMLGPDGQPVESMALEDICSSVFLLLLYYWLVNVDVDLDIKYMLHTNKHQILKSNLAAVG